MVINSWQLSPSRWQQGERKEGKGQQQKRRQSVRLYNSSWLQPHAWWNISALQALQNGSKFSEALHNTSGQNEQYRKSNWKCFSGPDLDNLAKFNLVRS